MNTNMSIATTATAPATATANSNIEFATITYLIATRDNRFTITTKTPYKYIRKYTLYNKNDYKNALKEMAHIIMYDSVNQHVIDNTN